MLTPAALLLALAATLVSGMTTMAPAVSVNEVPTTVPPKTDAPVVQTTAAKPPGPHHPGPHHPVHVEPHNFQYNEHTHELILSTKDACFILQLSDDQMQQVASPDGLRAFEIQLLTAAGNTAGLTQAQPHQHMDHHTEEACHIHHGHHADKGTVYYVS